MKNTIQTTVINTTEQLGSLVDRLVLHHALPTYSSPSMYIDIEGSDLCRHGSLSILSLLFVTGGTRQAYLIDIHTLGAEAFNTSGVKKKTLKDILQDETIPKVFFDVRNDSDALFAHFGVALQGMEDVQLMESATRTTTASRKFLSGLAKCVEQNVLILHGSDLASWKQVKEKGGRLFKAEHGGSYEVFSQRPIPQDIVAYCVGDVQYLPELRDCFWRLKTYQWQDLVKTKSMERVSASQKPEYQPHGADRTTSPWSQEQHRILDQWNYIPPAHDYNDDYFSELSYQDCYDDGWDGHEDFEDWTRADWQGPPS